MSEDTESEADHEDHDHHPHDHGGADGEHAGRVTSPMQEFGTGEVAFGAVIAAVGMVVTIVVPLLLV